MFIIYSNSFTIIFFVVHRIYNWTAAVTLDSADIDMFVCMHNLALLYSRQGKFEAAEKLYNDLLKQMAKKRLGPNHPDTIRFKVIYNI